MTRAEFLHDYVLRHVRSGTSSVSIVVAEANQVADEINRFARWQEPVNIWAACTCGPNRARFKDAAHMFGCPEKTLEDATYNAARLEREECAKLVESWSEPTDVVESNLLQALAVKIRQRGEK